MTAILGISAYCHDSAAALVIDGKIMAAAQEERFARHKHDFRFPVNAVDYCLREAGIRQADLGYVVFYDKPFLKFDRMLETYLAFAPVGLRSFLTAMPLWLKEKLHLPREIRNARYPQRQPARQPGWRLVAQHGSSHDPVLDVSPCERDEMVMCGVRQSGPSSHDLVRLPRGLVLLGAHRNHHRTVAPVLS